MAENDLDFVLDGNAAAGALREVFAADVTTAHIQCDACGSARSGGFSALLCSPDGSRAEVQQLCGHRPSGGPHAAWPLAGNDGRALPQSCSDLRGERTHFTSKTVPALAVTSEEAVLGKAIRRLRADERAVN